MKGFGVIERSIAIPVEKFNRSMLNEFFGANRLAPQMFFSARLVGSEVHLEVVRILPSQRDAVARARRLKLPSIFEARSGLEKVLMDPDEQWDFNMQLFAMPKVLVGTDPGGDASPYSQGAGGNVVVQQGGILGQGGEDIEGQGGEEILQQ